MAGEERPLGRITIGGSLEPRKVPALIRAIEKAEAGLKANSVGVDEVDVMEIANDGESLELFTRQVQPGGDMPALEQFCRRNHLTYRRLTRGGTTSDSSEAFWKPGLAIPHRCLLNKRTGDVYYGMTFLLSLKNHKVNLNEWVVSFKKNFLATIPPLEIS